MEAISGSWIFAVFMWLLVLIIIVRSVKNYRAKRKLPVDPRTGRTNRRLAIKNLKFFLGINDKNDEDKSMNHENDDDVALFK